MSLRQPAGLELEAGTVRPCMGYIKLFIIILIGSLLLIISILVLRTYHVCACRTGAGTARPWTTSSSTLRHASEGAVPVAARGTHKGGTRRPGPGPGWPAK